MDPQIHGAIVGGVLGGAVVLAALGIERAFRQHDEEQARTSQAAADAIRAYAAGVSRNVRAVKGTDAHLESGAQITGAVAQLLVLGPPEVGKRLAEFDAAGMNLATSDGQLAFLRVLEAVRSSFLPNQPALDRRLAAEVLFETVHIGNEGGSGSGETATKIGWRPFRR